MHVTLVGDQTGERSPLLIERFLRDSDGVWRQIRLEYRLDSLIWQMLFNAMCCLAAYGAVLGISNGILQALSSAIKLPVLYLLTLAICLPTLYLFNLLYGGQLSARQALALVLAAITVAANLALAFAPITIFFLLTAPNYAFYLVLNVAVLTLSSIIGLRFLVRGMHTINALDLVAPPEGAEVAATTARRRPVSTTLLWVWLILYAFVGTQLAWTLRPFFGYPSQTFELFRPLEGNFYTSLVQTVLSLVQ